MRIILIKGGGDYGALGLFADELAAAAARAGHEVAVADAEGQDLGLALERAMEKRPAQLALSFAGPFATYHDAQGRDVGQLIGGAHVVQMVDHPLAHSATLERAPAATAWLVLDRSHVRAIHDLFGVARFAHVGFSPTAGVGEPVPPEPNADAFAAARPTAILFAGTLYKPAPEPWAALKLPPPVLAICNNALELALSTEWTPALDAMSRAMREAGLDPSDPDFRVFKTLANTVHEQVRGHRRFAFFKAAAKVGLPITVYGRGFERDLYRFKNLDWRGPAALDVVTAEMARSRMVMNINANFGEGAHDRPFSAMLAGAVAATDSSSFYEEAFQPGVDMATYRWMSLEEDLTGIGELVRSPEALWTMARAGHAQAVAHHRWDNRLAAIFAAAGLST